MLLSVHPFVSMPVAHFPCSKGAFKGYGYYKTLIGNHILGVEPTENGRNDNEAVADATPDALTRQVAAPMTCPRRTAVGWTPRDTFLIICSSPWVVK